MSERPFPAYEGDQPYFFVCYAHEDVLQVYEEMRWIGAAGFNLWYDDGIHVGSVWRRVLAEALERSAGLIFMQTANSVRSEFCLNEMRFALDEEKPIIVLQLEDSTLPAELRLSLGDRQALVRQNLAPEIFRDKLLDSLKNCLDGHHVPPPPQPASVDPALAIRQRRRRDRERRILLSTVTAIEPAETSDSQMLVDALTTGGGELLGREGNTLFAAFDSAATALTTISSLPGSFRAGLSGGDLLFEDGLFHGSPVMEAKALKTRAAPNEFLAARHISELMPNAQIMDQSPPALELGDGSRLEFVHIARARDNPSC